MQTYFSSSSQPRYQGRTREMISFMWYINFKWPNHQQHNTQTKQLHTHIQHWHKIKQWKQQRADAQSERVCFGRSLSRWEQCESEAIAIEERGKEEWKKKLSRAELHLKMKFCRREIISSFSHSRGNRFFSTILRVAKYWNITSLKLWWVSFVLSSHGRSG